MALKRAAKALRKARRTRRRFPSATPLPPRRLKRPLPPIASRQ